MQRIGFTVLILASLILANAGAASASLITFTISIDTSLVAGTPGGIYLDFSTGADSDPATVAITNFSPSGGLSGGPDLAPGFTDGDVSGTLDAGDLVFGNNTSATNEYTEALTFGSTLSLEATFDVPNVLLGTSGSELDIQLTESDLLTPILTTDPSGNIVEISYDQTGTFTKTSTSSAATITEIGTSTPEPATGASLSIMAALAAASSLWRRRRSAVR